MTGNSIDDQSTQPLTIYTIGHSNVPANKIVELLKSQGIEVLVDVRSSPYSKYVPQFNRDPFQISLKQAGIEYRFAGEYLGGRPKDPTCYKSGQLPAGHVDFLHEVDYPAVMTKEWYQKGIKRLLEIAEESRTAVMCSEEDPVKCHRHHLISQTLLMQGVAVLHIRHKGKLQTASLLPSQEEKQLDLLSLVKTETTVTEPTTIEPGVTQVPITEQESFGPELTYEPMNEWDWSEADSFLEHPFFNVGNQPIMNKNEGGKSSKSSKGKNKGIKSDDQYQLF